MDGKGDVPRRNKRRFEDMETFRDRRAQELMAEKRRFSLGVFYHHAVSSYSSCPV
jgi:hypothetical protein